MGKDSKLSIWRISASATKRISKCWNLIFPDEVSGRNDDDDLADRRSLEQALLVRRNSGR